jgi:DNA-directed RNA polymerase specialized sigma24 family protein
MDEHDWRSERSEEHRIRLHAVAYRRIRLRAVVYRVLGSLSEVDDAVQEGWLWLSRSVASEVSTSTNTLPSPNRAVVAS